MKFSSLRVFLVATTIILFGHVTAKSVLGQIDRDTQRNGMHSCPEEQFVTGVNLRENLLKCTNAFGTYSRSAETVVRGTENRGQLDEMLACPEGMAMTGYHWRNNVVACAPVDRSIPRFLDAGTLMSSGGVVMHSCPASPVAGINESRSLLLCGTTGRGDRGHTGEFVDTGTQRNDMHSCARGFIVGVDVRRNLLLCSSAFGDYAADDERTIESSHGRPRCPEGMAMTGHRRNRGTITCARVTGPSTRRIFDDGTQRLGMHACPEGMPASGIDFIFNRLTCGTSGEPLRGMTITSVTPESPRVGDLVVISGYLIGSASSISDIRSGVSGVALDEVGTRSRRPGLTEGAVTSASVRRFWAPVIEQTPDRILVVIEQIPPGDYSISIQDRQPEDFETGDFVRAAESNSLSITVQQPSPGTSRNEPRTSMDATMVRRVHPRLAMGGQVLDVYGDFPFPSVDRFDVVARRIGPGGNPNTGGLLRPTSITKNHLTVRLPDWFPAGEWSLSVRVRGGGPEGTAARFFVRSSPPPQWEYISNLIGGTGTVPFRLVAAEADVGPNGWSVDILGYGFGPNQAGRPLYVLTSELLEGIKSNLRAGPNGALHPVPAYEEAGFWSETRIRVEIPHRPGEAPTPGVRYLVIKERNREHWSNAVSVRISSHP